MVVPITKDRCEGTKSSNFLALATISASSWRSATDSFRSNVPFLDVRILAQDNREGEIWSNCALSRGWCGCACLCASVKHCVRGCVCACARTGARECGMAPCCAFRTGTGKKIASPTRGAKALFSRTRTVSSVCVLHLLNLCLIVFLVMEPVLLFVHITHRARTDTGNCGHLSSLSYQQQGIVTPLLLPVCLLRQ